MAVSEGRPAPLWPLTSWRERLPSAARGCSGRGLCFDPLGGGGLKEEYLAGSLNFLHLYRATKTPKWPLSNRDPMI